MDRSSSLSELKLHGKWDLYYHLPNDKNWNMLSYKIINKNISLVNDLISLNEGVSEKIVKFCMLFVMRSGIAPMWEDPQNRRGGCFSYKVLNKHVYEIWKTLFYALCGETLCKNVKDAHSLNGITISPKKNFCIVKIWLSDCKLQDPTEIIDIQNLSTQGCLFKKHAPEF
jgi:hypothetical protein